MVLNENLLRSLNPHLCFKNLSIDSKTLRNLFPAIEKRVNFAIY